MKSLGTVFKQVYGEGLKEHGFVKIKGKQPYFVRTVGGEIVHVITYIPRPSLVQGKKEYMIMGGVATVYRHCINLDKTPRDSNWLITLGDFYCEKYLMTVPYESLNKWNTFSYDAENEESMIESVRYSLEVIREIMLPILDEVQDLEKCMDYYDLYDSPIVNIYVDEKFGLRNNSGEYNEGLLNFKLFNCEHFIMRREERIKRGRESTMYLISVGGIGYTVETYAKEELRMKERLMKTIEKYKGVVNNPAEYERVMKELERRKEFNIKNLENYGIYI